MVSLNAANSTLFVQRFFIFWRRYYVYIPDDGVYRLEVFSLKQQKAAALRKAQHATSTTSAS